MSAEYEILNAGAPALRELRAVAPLPPFAPVAVDFVAALSACLMDSREARAHPELTALAFWMRRASMARVENEFRQGSGARLLVARGTAFHIAPSNVDTIFVYSWLLSMLSGNRNIVRLSSRRTRQSDILVAAVTGMLAQTVHAAIAARTLLVRYPADDAITTRLSAACDVRVIWGGDETVEHVRRLPLPPAAIDLGFANKTSIALINVAHWLAADDADQVETVRKFCNDAYWFDQMACSSPKSVFWIGQRDDARRAAERFWALLDRLLVAKGSRMADADYVNKLVAVDSLAIDHAIEVRTGAGNALVRAWLETPALHVSYNCGAGLFFECALPELAALRPLLTRTVQTVVYHGWPAAEMRAFVAQAPLAGIDRVVPFGQALDFAQVWDGFDLTRVFMREITVH